MIAIVKQTPDVFDRDWYHGNITGSKSFVYVTYEPVMQFLDLAVFQSRWRVVTYEEAMPVLSEVSGIAEIIRIIVQRHARRARVPLV